LDSLSSLSDSDSDLDFTHSPKLSHPPSSVSSHTINVNLPDPPSLPPLPYKMD
jgi:hypothetical protein